MIRYLFTLLTILLYVLPFYKDHLSSQKKGWDNRVVVDNDKGELLVNEKPFYSEDFVTREKTGIMAHVSSICPLGFNKMACTWYSGSREGARDVAIYFSIFNEEEGNWTDPIVLVDRKQSSNELNRYVKKVGNSLIFSDKSDRLWLFYVSLPFGGWSATSLNYKVSLNGGKTWSKSRKMILSPFFNLTNNVKNKGINLDDGSFIIPVYHEFIKKNSQLVWIRPGEYTLSYEIKKINHERSLIQPSLLHEGGKNLVAFFRNMESENMNYILMAHSYDLGQSWSEIADTPLLNPNSGFDTIKLSNGNYIGVINNSFKGRSNLTIVISYDRGKTWKPLRILESSPGEEYSYASLSRSKRGFYHLTYTYKKRRIKHIVFNEAWIKQID